VRASSELPVRVYDAEAVRTTVASSIARAATEISAARGVIWRLFARDFVSQFRQRLLGYAWTLLTPLVGIASFVFLNYAGVLHPGELTIPYPLYVFLGTSVWGLMLGCVLAVSGALLTHGDLVLRTSIPKMALAVSSITGLLYGQVVNFVVLGVILVIFGVLPSWGALLLPVLLVPVILLGVGIGLALAVTGAIARDVTNAAATLLGLVLYITPAIYVPTSSNRWLRAAITYNPLTYLIDEPRNLFFHGVVAHPIGLVLAVLFSILTLVVGIHAFYLIQDHVAERL
jgi:homopolymeric O-antigen transport system permease protein